MTSLNLIRTQLHFAGGFLPKNYIKLRSTTNVFEAVQKTHSMYFGVETLSYASLMNVLCPIKHFCFFLIITESKKMLV